MTRHMLIILWLLVLTSKATLAKHPQLRLETGAGLSQPLFAYAATDLNKGCFTLSGLQTAATISTNISGKIWLEARFEAQLHPVDVSSLGYQRVMADPFLTDTYIRSEPYRNLAMMAGPSYLSPISSRFDVQASVFAGMMQSKSPYQLHKPVYFMTGPEYFEITSAIDYAAAFGAELASSWKATSCYHLKLSASFMQGKADFRFRTSSGIRTDTRTISTLNLRAGLVFIIPPP